MPMNNNCIIYINSASIFLILLYIHFFFTYIQSPTDQYYVEE